MSVTIRAATEADVPAIRDIYNEAVLHTTATFDLEEKSLDERLEWFRDFQPPHCLIVAERASEVLGYACLRQFRTKPAYRFTVENSVYIAPDHQGRGIGTILLRELITLARQGGFHTIIAGIAEGNPASEALHEKFGFTRVAHEREVGYKFERWLDVFWYQLML
ncbi:MAG TPA: GNAT family N-acetyltransferase [Dehalococcoidia bacterium]|nr:GNAT family N-acetyltransferase [Dehalococcoidia bacterium]